MESLLSRLIKHDDEDDKAAAEEENSSQQGEAEEESALLDQLIAQTNAQGILVLVEKMGIYLVSEDTVLRVKSTALLCECIRALEDTEQRLATNQLQTLLLFFLNRYKTDWESALACLRAIKALLNRKSLNKKRLFQQDGMSAGAIALSLLTDHDVAELIQSLRMLVFEICLVLATEFRDYAFAGENWFAQAFQTAMEGERDPRCLLVCLKVLRALLVEAPPSWDLVEDAFELTNVYFPITFQPPPNDPFGITHGDLVDALNQVFVANERIAVCAMPMALERITSLDGDEGGGAAIGTLAKVESLRLIGLCASKFNAEVVLAQHLSLLRDSLLSLVMGGAEEDEVVAEALQVVTCVTRALATRGLADARDGLWDAFVLQTLRNCGQSLEASMDSMSAQGASKIICAVGLASSFALQVVLRGMIPLLEKLLREDIPSKRLACLELVRNLCRCVDRQISHFKGEGPLDSFAPALFDMVAALVEPGKTEDAILVSCFLTLKELVCRPAHLLVDGETQVRALTRRIFAICLEGIHDTAQGATNKRDVVVVGMVCIRDMEAKTGGKGEFIAECIDTLLGELETSSAGPATELMLQLLPMLLVDGDSSSNGQSVVEPSVVQRVVKFLLRGGGNKSIAREADATLARIARTIPGELLETLAFDDLKSHQQVLAVYLERISATSNEELTLQALARWDENGLPEPYVATTLLTMRRDYAGVLPTIVGKVRANLALWTGSELLLNVFTCAVNKAPLGQEFDACMSEILALGEREDKTAEHDLLCTKLFARCFRALVWRSSTAYADKLGAFLHAQLHSADAAVAYEASLGFAQVLQPLHFPFARVMGLAKQRTFTKWFPLLFDDLSTTSAVGKNEAVLMACASLAANTPVAILKPKLSQVVLVMVRASNSEANEVKLCALQILKQLLAMVEEEGDFVASDHLHSLIPFLLAFANNSGGGGAYSVEARLDALHCLELLPQILKYHQLHPFRSLVSNTLAKGALDDGRKRVRLQAVKCRERWVLFAAT